MERKEEEQQTQGTQFTAMSPRVTEEESGGHSGWVLACASEQQHCDSNPGPCSLSNPPPKAGSSLASLPPRLWRMSYRQWTYTKSSNICQRIENRCPW